MPRHDYPDRKPQSGKHRQKPRRCVQDGDAGDRRCRDRRCRDVPAGASDMSTGRRMLLQRTDTLKPPRASRCLPQKNLRAPTLCIPSFINVCALCRHTFILKNNGRTLSVRPYISLLTGNRNQGYGGKGKKRIRPTCLCMFSTFSKLPFPYFVK